MTLKWALKNRFQAVPSAVPDLSLALTVFGWNRSRDTPSPSLWSPSNLFCSRNLWHNLRHPRPLRPANTVFELNSLWPSNHGLPNSSELFHRGGGLCQPASPTPTSLWASVSTTMTGLWRAWATSASWPRSVRAPIVSWRHQTSVAAAPSPRTCRSLPKTCWVKLRMAWKPPRCEKNLN